MRLQFMLLIVALAIGISWADIASGQAPGVGLYDPEFRALRTVFGPTGTPNMPSDPDRTEIAGAWNRISRSGRDLLLKQSGLVLVVVDGQGNWLYRSSGIYTLTPLYTRGEPVRKEDLKDLMQILDGVYFQKLRDFYMQVLFARGSPSASGVGALLSSIDNLPTAKPEQKEWFRSVVGEEIRGFDPSVRTRLLLDPAHGTVLASAVAAAEARRSEQLQKIATLKTGPGKSISVTDFFSRLLPGGSTIRTGDEVRVVEGKLILTCAMPSGTAFLTAKDNHLLSGESLMSAKKLQDLLEADKAQMYWVAPGNKDIIKVTPTVPK